MHLHMCVFLRVCVHLHVYALAYVCLHACARICVCVCVCVSWWGTVGHGGHTNQLSIMPASVCFSLRGFKKMNQLFVVIWKKASRVERDKEERDGEIERKGRNIACKH